MINNNNNNNNNNDKCETKYVLVLPTEERKGKRRIFCENTRRNISDLELLPFRGVILIHLPECTPDVTKSTASFYLAAENCALMAIPALLAAVDG